MLYPPTRDAHVETEVSLSAAALGGLTGSGFQSPALSFRLFYDLGLTVKSNVVEPGMEFAPGKMMVHEENIAITEDASELLTIRAAREMPVIG